jgi:hypothetical protein
MTILFLCVTGFSKEAPKPADTPAAQSVKEALENATPPSAGPVLFLSAENGVQKATNLRMQPYRDPGQASSTGNGEAPGWEAVRERPRQRALSPLRWEPAASQAAKPTYPEKVQMKLRQRAMAPFRDPGSCAKTKKGKVAIGKVFIAELSNHPPASEGRTIPEPPPPSEPQAAAAPEEPDKFAIPTVKMYSKSEPPAEEAFMPEPPSLEPAKAALELRIQAPKADVPVYLLVSTKLRDQAAHTAHGAFYLETPLAARIAIGVVPPEGDIAIPFKMIPDYDSAKEIYLQALVGKELSNLCILRVN